MLNGRLNLLLQKYEPAVLPVGQVSPEAQLMPQKLNAFLDFVGSASRRA